MLICTPNISFMFCCEMNPYFNLVGGSTGSNIPVVVYILNKSLLIDEMCALSVIIYNCTSVNCSTKCFHIYIYIYNEILWNFCLDY